MTLKQQSVLIFLMYTSCRRAGGRHDMSPPPASWQYLRIYSPGGNYCML